jgi:chromosome segregation ATPase
MLMTINVEELQEEIPVLDVKDEVCKQKLDRKSFEEKMEDVNNETLSIIKNTFEEENKKLKEDIEKIIEEKEVTIKERRESQVLLQAMEVEREKLTGLMDKTTKQKEDLQKELEEAQNLLQQKNSDDMVKSLKEENVKLQSENESLQKQLQENKVEMEKLVKEKEKVVQELTTREADFSVSFIESQQNSQSKITELEAILHQLQEENKLLKTNLGLGLDGKEEKMCEKGGNTEEIGKEVVI